MVVGIASQTDWQDLWNDREAVYRKMRSCREWAQVPTTSDHLISDDPSLYRIVRKYISPGGFHRELYRKVAERLFDELDRDQFQPAGSSSVCLKMRKNRGRLRSCSIPRSPSCPPARRGERAFHDILLAVKKNSYQYYMAKLGRMSMP